MKNKTSEKEMATRLQEQIIRFKAAMEFTALKHMEVQSMNYISLH